MAGPIALFDERSPEDRAREQQLIRERFDNGSPGGNPADQRAQLEHLAQGMDAGLTFAQAVGRPDGGQLFPEQDVEHPQFGSLSVPDRFAQIMAENSGVQNAAPTEATPSDAADGYTEPLIEYDDPFYGRVSINARDAKILESLRRPPEEKPSEGIGLGDYGAAVMAGGAQLVQGAGWLARQFGADDAGSFVEELGADAVDYWNNAMSESARQELAREFVVQDEEGNYSWGDASLSTVGLMGAQSLLGTAAGMGVGAGITKVLQVFANPAGRAVLQQKVLAGAGSGASVKAQTEAAAALKKLKVVDGVLGAAGFGAGEGLISGMATGSSVEREVMEMPHEKLAESQRYQIAYQSMDNMGLTEEQRRAYAKEMVAEDLAMQAGWRSMGAAALLGAPMGAAFGKMIGQRANNLMSATRTRNVVASAAGEAVQEAGQSASETVIGNVAMQEVDPERKTLDGALSAAVGGAAAGSVLGGAFGLAATPTGKKKNTPEGTAASVTAAVDQARARGISDAQIAAIMDDPARKPITKIRDLKAAQPGDPEVTARDALDPTPREQVDAAGKQAATSPDNDLPEPTQAQKDAGNYKKGKVRVDGFDLSIENPAGSTRSGTDDDGNEWSSTLANDYGYIRGTRGADGDQVDVSIGAYVGDDEQAPEVYVVDQLTPDGDFDEHKVMMGFRSAEEAEQAYLGNYEAGWDRYAAVTPMSRDEFKAWVRDGAKTEPVSDLLYSKTPPKTAPAKTAPAKSDGEHTLRHAAAERAGRRGRLTETARASVIAAAEAAGYDPLPFTNRAVEQQRRFAKSDGWQPLENVANAKVDRKGNPKIEWKPIPYSFHVEPKTGKANKKTEPARVKRTANKLVAEIRNIYKRAEQGDKNAQTIARQSEWYSAMRSRLRAEFGGAGDAMADLLGATSPKTPVKSNWDSAIDIMGQISEGRATGPLKAFLDHLEAGGTPTAYDGPQIVKRTGMKYGTNSKSVLLAVANLWRVTKGGGAPKARNFSMNLIGGSDAATIDVWAARTLQRLTNQPRIPPPAEGAVAGDYSSAKTAKPGETTGPFGFGQAVFAQAAEQLGMQPHELQAMAWFMEKEIWGQNKWTTSDGEGGSFEEQADIAKLSRYVVGLSIQQDAPPVSAAVVKAANELRDEVKKDPAAVAYRTSASSGLYAGSEEMAFDFEITAKPGFRVDRLVRSIVKAAKKHSQYDTFVSRVLGPDEDSANARPGLEVYFKSPGVTREMIDPVVAQIRAVGLDGMTLIVDPRASILGQDGTYVGLRVQFVPEFTARWDDDFRAEMKLPGAMERAYERAEAAFDTVQETVLGMPGVVASRRVEYDTLVIGQEYYDAYLARKAGAAGEAAEAGGFPSSRGESLGRAIAGYEGRPVGPGDLPGRDDGPEIFASRSVTPAGALVYPNRVKAHTQRIADNLRQAIAEVAPYAKVEVVHRIQDLPFRSRDIDLTTEGLYDRRSGNVYLIGKNLESVARAQEVFLHEVFGHSAMENLPGYADVLAAVRGQVVARAPDYRPYIEQVEATQPGLDATTKAREVIAVMAERGIRNPLMARLIAQTRQLIRRLGFNLRLSQADVRHLIATAARRYRAGVVRAPDTQATTPGELDLAYSVARADVHAYSEAMIDEMIAVSAGEHPNGERHHVGRMMGSVFNRMAGDSRSGGLPFLWLRDGQVIYASGRAQGDGSVPVTVFTEGRVSEIMRLGDLQAPTPKLVEILPSNRAAMMTAVGPVAGAAVSVKHTPAEKRFWREIATSEADMTELLDEVPTALIRPDGSLTVHPSDVDNLSRWVDDLIVLERGRLNQIPPRLRDDRYLLMFAEEATRYAQTILAGSAEAGGLQQSGSVRGGPEPLAQSRRPNPRDRYAGLEGLPATVDVQGRGQVTFGVHRPARDAAYAYAKAAGLDYAPARTYAKLDRARATRIANAFEALEHDPQNPDVKAAYAAMIEETAAQYREILKTGLTVEFIDYATTGDPYGNPRNAVLDVTENNHLWVFSTRDGFGSDEAFDVTDNPLLGETEFEISGQVALANDIFRVVHDYFGHIKDGVGFRAEGEENAWRSHAAMYSPLARRAMTTETRGQNSWVNFGPQAQANRTASGADTVYADQKVGLLPAWASEDGMGDADLLQSRSKPPEAVPYVRKGRRWTLDGATITQAEIATQVNEQLREIAAQIKDRSPSAARFAWDYLPTLKRVEGVKGIDEVAAQKVRREATMFTPVTNDPGPRLTDEQAKIAGEIAQAYDQYDYYFTTLIREKEGGDGSLASRRRLRALETQLDGLAQRIDELQQQMDGPDLLQSRTQTPAFKKWFGESKVVDEKSKPLVVYHGTDSEFITFDGGRDGSAQGFESQVPGFWFAQDSGIAKQFGSRTISAYLSIRNPFIIDAADYLQKFSYDGEDPAAFRADLEANGYDGMIINPDPEYVGGRGPLGTEEWGQKNYIAFKPEQIKSATGNAGTFDAENPDILQSRGLPMDNASRMKRARAAGFNTRLRLYHGSAEDVPAFSNTAIGVWLTDDPEIASGYATNFDDQDFDPPQAANVMPLFVRGKALEVEGYPSYAEMRKILGGDMPEFSNSMTFAAMEQAVMARAQELGYSHIVYRDLADLGADRQDQWFVFNPADVRSVNAVFDEGDAASSTPDLLQSRAKTTGLTVGDLLGDTPELREVFDVPVRVVERKRGASYDALYDRMKKEIRVSKAHLRSRVILREEAYHALQDLRGEITPDRMSIDLGEVNPTRELLDGYNDLADIMVRAGVPLDNIPSLDIFPFADDAFDLVDDMVFAVGKATNDPDLLNGAEEAAWNLNKALENKANYRTPNEVLHDSPVEKEAAAFAEQDTRPLAPKNPDVLSSKRRATMSDSYEAIARDVMEAPSEDLSWRDRLDRLKQRWRLWDRGAIRQGIIDAGYAIERMERGLTGGGLMDAMDSAYKAFVATKNLPSVLAAMGKHGAPVLKDGVFQIVDGRKGWEQIFHDLVDADGNSLLHAWEVYAAARRADRLLTEQNFDGTSREKNFSRPQVDAILREGNAVLDANGQPLFARVFDEWQTFHNQLLDEAVRIGAMDPEMRKAWATNDYIPFHRAVDLVASASFDGTEGDSQVAGSSGRGVSGKRVSSMRLTGSDKKIQGQVFENLMMNVAKITDTMYKHVAMERIIALGDGVVMQKVPYAAKALKLTGGQLAQAMTQGGLINAPAGHPDPTQYAREVIKRMTPDQRNQWQTVFQRVAPAGRNLVSVMENGKLAYYEVMDPLLLRSINALGVRNFEGIFWKMFRGPKGFITAMITADPAFMIANFARDTLSAWVQSDAKLIPFADSIKGFKRALAEDPMLFKIMMAGGGGGGFYVQDREELRQLISTRVPSNQVDGFMRSVVRLDSQNSLWSAWQKVGSASENANRLAVAKRVLEAGGTMAEASYQAQDLLNFSMRGDYAVVQALIETVPFMNARIQGLYRLYRGARDNPMGFFLKGSMIMMASMALLAKNWDDERYQSLQEWDRDTYWHVWIGSAHIRIPKPFEVGALYGTIPERMMQTMLGREDSALFASRIGTMILETFAMNPTPQTLRPLIEQFFNSDMFTGNPVVGMSLDGLPAEAQYNARTSETMRALAEAMPDWAPEWLRSPKRLEHAVNGFTGSMGMYVLASADELTRGLTGASERPTLKIWDVPVAKRFLRDPVPFSNKWQDVLYETSNEANEIARAVNEYISQGEREKAMELREAHLPKLQVRGALNRVRRNISVINNKITMLSFSDKPGEEKYEKIQLLKQKKLEQLALVERYAGVF